MIRSAFLALSAGIAAGTPALAAERNFSVTTFDRVRVEGPFAVSLSTGRAVSAKASGSPQALDGVAVEVQGRTLIVRPNRSSWGGYPGKPAGPVRIALSTHDLAAAIVNGAGSLTIDRVKGLAFESMVQGSGSVAIGDVAVDRLSAGLDGSGSMQAAGKALKVTAMVRGSSSFDGSGLSAKDATVGAEGPATVQLTVTNTAQVTAAGLATVTLAGRPACTAKASGSASVSGCR
ncbi:GIN domain-containing protein [Sphingomonas sp. GCM10030256]|uniref:GIN domain-containing protein n=1 Tax=Sphingomonas sp. GCM10030256 TaxID=3273427 RepID=UPI0036076C45